MNKYTIEFYSNLQKAYDYFNKELFQDELPQCVIVCNRKKNVLGYHCPNVFKDNDQNNISEIALNPDHFNRDSKEILSTLAHEMAHLLMFVKGNGTKKGFHNKQWGEAMLQIGLQPLDTETGEEKLTGFKMTHRIIEGDLFDLVSDKLLEMISFDFVNISEEEKPKKERKKNKNKFQCPVCGIEVSGKGEIRLKCLDCDKELEREEDEEKW
jgi:hypothetical protein